MDVVAELVAPCSPAELYHWVEDLELYPQWLEIVTRAVRLDDDVWEIDLRGRLGPLARSKRLQMVRTVHDGATARFERVESDGRDHSPWVLEVVVAPNNEVDGDAGEHSEGTHLRMHLHYGGGLFGPVLERLLRDEIERSRERLLALVGA
ncbi:MAG: SRPBCC family protein [Aquihabitans sp.]